METNKILTASILDLLFDNRNKDYGAYELRKTYRGRIMKSLLITLSITGVVYAVAALGIKTKDKGRYEMTPGVIVDVIPEQKPAEKIEPPKKIDLPPVRTEIFTPPVIVDKDKLDNPPPSTDDLDSAKIGLIKTNGIADNGFTEITKINDNTGIVDDKTKDKDDGPFTVVQVEAKYAGDWKKFLERNLRAEVPADNGAPAGRYTIIIQFVVDVDGTVSNIVPLTHLGYGMEEEAVRVLKKADKWEPAFQNGTHVKAYRRQPITFEVLSD